MCLKGVVCFKQDFLLGLGALCVFIRASSDTIGGMDLFFVEASGIYLCIFSCSPYCYAINKHSNLTILSSKGSLGSQF